MDVKKLLRVGEFCRRARIGKTLFYALVQQRKIKVVKRGRSTERWPQGKMTLIPESELTAFLGPEQ